MLDTGKQRTCWLNSILRGLKWDCSPKTSETMMTAASEASREPLTYTSKPANFSSVPVQLPATDRTAWCVAGSKLLPKPQTNYQFSVPHNIDQLQFWKLFERIQQRNYAISLLDPPWKRIRSTTTASANRDISSGLIWSPRASWAQMQNS